MVMRDTCAVTWDAGRALRRDVAPLGRQHRIGVGGRRPDAHASLGTMVSPAAPPPTKRRLEPRQHTDFGPSPTTRRLEPRQHTDFGGIPYFDRELGVPQSRSHQQMVSETGAVLAAVARDAGLLFLSDHPIWYEHPETDEQLAYYGDWVFAVGEERTITADGLLVVVEVVTIGDRRKEVKDTGFQRLLNEYNGVPEFGLVFPELEDSRALTWCRLEDGRYTELDVASGGRIAVRGVPGLELEVKQRAQWTDGDKIDVWYRGEHRPRLAGERARAEEERARADRLAAKLRELGLDPEAL